ncbi:unnamed protein product [marine sediment metagenome]|uniref:Uncharacterized protein n=1 Tax=marine sediment metagenome TaxID=412755 RepID=X1NE46_9ZZZZ
MAMQRLSSLTDQEEPPQQPVPITRVCWDDLFSFLIRFLKPLRPRKPAVVMNSLEAETTTNYKLLVSWEIPADYEGILNEISLYASNGGKGLFFVKVADQELFTDQKILAKVLTLPWKELPLLAGIKVIVAVKTSDGTATDFGATITGELRYLGKR